MKVFVICSTSLLYVLAFANYIDSPTELDLWCKDIVKNKELIYKEPLGDALLEVCTSKRHLKTLNEIVYQ